jgi:hypothetical protein
MASLRPCHQMPPMQDDPAKTRCVRAIVFGALTTGVPHPTALHRSCENTLTI